MPSPPLLAAITAYGADMAMIAGQLHANAVRVTGTDLSRVAIAAGLAREAGLTVWFSPHPGDLAGEDIVCYLAEAARKAEEPPPTGKRGCSMIRLLLGIGPARSGPIPSTRRKPA